MIDKRRTENVVRDKVYNMWKEVRRKAKRSGRAVCPEWSESGRFREWYEPRAFPGCYVDMGEDGEVGPATCRVVSRREFFAERSQLHEAFGELKTLREWAEDVRCAVSLNCLRARYRHAGWPLELSLTAGEWSHVRRYHETEPGPGRDYDAFVAALSPSQGGGGEGGGG